MRPHLTEQQINRALRPGAAKTGGAEFGKVTPFHFRRPDRIAKAQLHTLQQVHDGFVRNLGSSLSAYLRSYLVINMVSVEQSSYSDFIERLPSPTCVAAAGLRPYEGNAAIALNSSIIFPVLEILLGGKGKTPFNAQREITAIEQGLLDGLFRLIVRDLKEAWKFVADIDFSIESLETGPQLAQILPPGEEVVAVGMEIRLGEAAGVLNIAMPSIIVKTMRRQSHQQSSRKGPSGHEEGRMLDLIRPAVLNSEVLLSGPQVLLRDLVNLEAGDVINFDYPFGAMLEMRLNSKPKFRGQVVRSGRRAGFRIEESVREVLL